MQRLILKLQSLWARLPKEVRVGIYIAVSTTLASLASQLMGLGELDFISVFRVFVANILLVFVAELKPRIERIEASKQ